MGIGNNKLERDCEDSDSQSQLVRREFSRAKSYASEYRQSNTPIAHFFNTRLKRVSELLGDFNSGKVLDVGCGPAMICNIFRGKPIEYYGMDISEDMIKECIDTFGNDRQFNFSVGKMEKLPFPDSYFDVVLCLGAFEYVLDGVLAMKEIVRVLKPKGIVVITMLNKISPYRVWQSHVYGKIRNGTYKFRRLIRGIRNEQSSKGPVRPKARLYSEAGFRDLLTSNGLEIEDIVYYDFNLFLSPLDGWFPKESVFFSGKLEFLCRSRLKFLGTGYILKSRNM